MCAANNSDFPIEGDNRYEMERAMKVGLPRPSEAAIEMRKFGDNP